MNGNGAPKSVEEITISRDQLHDVEIMINRGSLESLGPYDDLLFSANNPNSYRRNYLQLRLNGYSHKDSLEFSWQLDHQYGHLQGKFQSTQDRHAQIQEMRIFYDYTAYMSQGAIDGDNLSRLLRSGGSIEEVRHVQSAITKAHPNLNRYERQDILHRFVNLRCN